MAEDTADSQEPHDPLASLRGQDPAAAAGALQLLPRAETLEHLAFAALEEAEIDLAQADRWLAALLLLSAPEAPPPLADYAAARLAVFHGDLEAAEAALRRAQAVWQATGDDGWLARSQLGLTQILAMHGEYAEAENAARAAMQILDPATAAGDVDASLRSAGARHNLATLYVMQDRHAPALALYDEARALLAALPGDDPELAEAVREEMAHNALNRASALTFLDRPLEAEAALQEAITLFSDLGDPVNRGRARTNLGRLRLRMGDFAAALREFDASAGDLLGVGSAAAIPSDEGLHLADELFLEHANAYLALNLLPEAAALLARAERLFRAAGQQLELGQTLYLTGLVNLRQSLPDDAQAALSEALGIFDPLQNRYWANRCRVALAVLARQRGDAATAEQRLAALAETPASDAGGALAWDLQTRVEALLLRGSLALGRDDTVVAEALAGRITAMETLPPHLALRVHHLLGRIARARGDYAGAQREFIRAVELLEMQRAALPLEEIRTAFLDDKTDLYADLLLALLDAPAAAGDDPAAALSAAFNAVERARSRALLERLLSAVGDSGAEGASPVDEARRRLHWLYNQLLGESGSRGLNAELSIALREEEGRVQALEWQLSPQLAQARPIALAEFQAALAPDRQAIVYATAGDELMAFLVTRNDVTLVRRLATAARLEEAHADLRFQLGRAAFGADYLARHARRLEESLRRVLRRFYQLAVEPLRPLLTCERLLVLPSGALHSVPFHALWDGERYLLESYEIALAPSASVAAHWAGDEGAWGNWAGLAINDAAIPAARREVEAAAAFFGAPALFLDEEASLQGLRAAASADILHVATHGLFRADNPFFSVLKLADGWIDVRELYRLPLAARLVVLSACESGAGILRAGDEVIGLARGFLAAGAHSLVASIWHVHDESAALLMQHFYAALTQQGCRPAAALRVAQRAALESGRHPYFWAPFYAMGD